MVLAGNRLLKVSFDRPASGSVEIELANVRLETARRKQTFG